MIPLAVAAFFVSGFAALLYQVVWQRMLAMFSGTDVYSVTVIVAAFMGGLGVGQLVISHSSGRNSTAKRSSTEHRSVPQRRSRPLTTAVTTGSKPQAPTEM